LHEDGVVIEAIEPDRPQEMREPVAARLELAIADGLAGPRHDDRRPIAVRFGMPARIHAVSPSRRGLLLSPNRTSHRRPALRPQRPITAIKLSTPTGEIRNRPE